MLSSMDRLLYLWVRVWVSDLGVSFVDILCRCVASAFVLSESSFVVFGVMSDVSVLVGLGSWGILS